MTPAARYRMAVAMTALATYAACGDQPAEVAVVPEPTTTTTEHHNPQAIDPTALDWEGVARIAEHQQRARAARNATTTTTRPPRRHGGTLPPDSVKQCESKGDYRAENPTSSASGGWQIIDGTWGGYKGYPRASDAPPHIQDEKAAQLWAGGKGASHWRSCL